jgi:hypothetical protein
MNVAYHCLVINLEPVFLSVYAVSFYWDSVNLDHPDHYVMNAAPFSQQVVHSSRIYYAFNKTIIFFNPICALMDALCSLFCCHQQKQQNSLS